MAMADAEIVFQLTPLQTWLRRRHIMNIPQIGAALLGSSGKAWADVTHLLSELESVISSLLGGGLAELSAEGRVALTDRLERPEKLCPGDLAEIFELSGRDGIRQGYVAGIVSGAGDLWAG